VRRYVGRAESGQVVGVNVVPGGPSGIPGDPGYATQLATWLTADYHTVKASSSASGGKKERFIPTAP
jgi:acyl-homoserine lactone acylase PvdQ